MALKDKWIDKINGVDINSADDINQVARAVIELEIKENGGGGGITEETDPTVPSWAKAASKPSYTASEVGAVSKTELTSAVNDALTRAKASGEFDGVDGVSPTISVSTITGGHRITITDKNGTKNVNVMDGAGGKNGTNGTNGRGIVSIVRTSGNGSAGTTDTYTIKYTDNTTSTFTVYNGEDGDDGSDGERGFSILRVTTAPSAYTTETGGFTPAYRIALSTVKSQASVEEVRVGDTILRNYYTYKVGYVDSSYAYLTTYASIRGTAGKDGVTPVKGTDYFTDADKTEMVNTVKDSIEGLDELVGSGLDEVTYTPNLGGYLAVDTGVINNMAQTYHTDYIALNGYGKIYAVYTLSSAGYALAFFDESKTLLPNISIKGAGTGGYHIIEMDVPSEATYCMLSCYDYYGNPAPNNYIKLIPTNGIIERMNKLEEDMANFVSTSPLNGKTIAVLGDSISSVAYTVPNYWQLIAEKTGCNFLDYGVSGACFAVRSGSTTSFVERAANMSENADAVLVMGGTNDANKNILLGEWASTDNTTLYGALNALIASLRSKYPGRPIIFCTPIKMKGDKDDGFPKTVADLKGATASTNLELWHCALAIQAKCAVHGIPVIDLYNASGIGSGLSAFFRPDDTLHPSDLGECRIANMVQPVLEHQFLYTTEYAAEPVNLVPTSIDTDGSIFNNIGYKDGYRLSSSGGVSAQAKSTVTGFIEFSTSDILRIKGVTMKDSDATGTYVNNAYINFYDASFNHIGSTSNGGNKGICTGLIDSYKTSETDGVHTYNFSSVDGTNVKYIRISSPYGEAGSGSGMFVTVNQEIA